MNPKYEYIQDQEMIALSQNPERFCEKYGIPVSKILNVSIIKNGRSNTFEHKGKPYKRVELIAKAHYEEQGFEVSWSEGISVLLVTVSISAAISRRVKDAFTMKSIDEYLIDTPSSIHFKDLLKDKASRYEKYKADFEQGSIACHQLIHSHLLKSRPRKTEGLKTNLDISSNDSELDESVANDSRHDLFHTIKDLELIHIRMQKAFEEIKANPPIDELMEHMNNFVNIQRERYSAPHMNFRLVNLNEWSIQFARRLIEIIGLEIFYSDKFSTVMSVSDLTLLDPVSKVVRFVEIKNKDGFTPTQLLHLQSWLKLSSEMRCSFELCLVQPT